MEVRTAPRFTSSTDSASTTCRIVVDYDWATTRYFLPDHLNSTNVLTDASGTQTQVLDYYPYGSTRISQTTGTFNEQKQYIGQYSDPETNLSYLQERYYDGSKGDFLSEDPVFLGDPKQQVLTDPQSLNSYSYANDNPITKSDPTGKFAPAAGAALLFDGGVALSAETLGASLLLAGGALYLAAHSSSPNLQDGAPGNYQAVKLAQGSGYNTDPELPSQPPKTPWKFAAWSAVVTGTGIIAIEEFCGDWCANLGQRSPFPGFAGNGPVTNLPNMAIGAYGTFTPTDRSACGALCFAPQQRTQTVPTPSSAQRSNSSPSSNTFSGGGSASGSRGGGGNAVSTWMGAFNPFQAH